MRINFKNIILQFFVTLFLFLIFLTFSSSCKSTTKPENDNKPDTTSHNYVWKIDTLGIEGSFLKDVSILNKNDIWAAGEIVFEDTYTYDSLGNWIDPYNVAHWDGIKWNLIRALAKNYHNNYYQKNAVRAFNIKNIWFGGTIASRWDGVKWDFFGSNEGWPKGFHISKIWGLTHEHIYYIGNAGNIVEYDNGTWTEMDSGTPLDLYDIHGTEETVFITGYNFVGDLSGQSIALQLIDGKWQPIFTSSSYSGDISMGDYGRLESVFVYGDTAYFATGGTGILKYNFKTKNTDFISKTSSLFRYLSLIKIVGTGYNDIMMISAWGNMVHFNGSTWKRIDEVHDIYGDAKLFPRNADYKNNTIAIVGRLDNRAVLIIGEHL
ncbi:MAG: hypothetical protein GXO77_03030, partial [Calditrichaeota bacterium]|nr:hypothetical protein [Calditrichota bacterium]